MTYHWSKIWFQTIDFLHIFDVIFDVVLQTETFADKLDLGIESLILRHATLFIFRSSIAKIDGVNSKIAKIVV